MILLRRFSRQRGISGFEAYAPANVLSVKEWRIYLPLTPYNTGTPVSIERPAYPTASLHRS
jgi:hypothetical protein